MATKVFKNSKQYNYGQLSNNRLNASSIGFPPEFRVPGSNLEKPWKNHDFSGLENNAENPEITRKFPEPGTWNFQVPTRDSENIPGSEPGTRKFSEFQPGTRNPGVFSDSDPERILFPLKTHHPPPPPFSLYAY